jgi:hypothetical protein
MLLRHSNSFERNPKPIVRFPNHTTGPARTSAIKRENKRIGNTDRRWHFHAHAEVRDIEDSAVKHRRAIMQNDCSVLQYACALNPSPILHASLPHFGARCIGPITLRLKCKRFMRGNQQCLVKDMFCARPSLRRPLTVLDARFDFDALWSAVHLAAASLLSVGKSPARGQRAPSGGN